MKKQLIRNIIIASLAVLLLSVLATVAILAAESATQTYGETLGSISASTGGKISLKFIYSDLGNADAYVAEVYAPDSDTATRTHTYKKDAIKENTVSVPLAPSEMAYTVKVYPVTLSGDEVIARGEGTASSVRAYALAVIASNDERHTPYHDAMRALLNWGAMAEKTFEEVAVTKANSGLYTKDTNPIDGVISSFANTAGKIISKANDAYGCKLTMTTGKDTSLLNFKFTGLPEGTYTATVSKNGGEDISASIIDDVVSISNVGVAVYDTNYTVTVKDQSGNEMIKAEGNALYYLSELAFAAGDNAKYNDIAKSMYQFYTLAMNKTAADCTHAAIHYRKNINAETHNVVCSNCFTALSRSMPVGASFYADGSETASGYWTGDTTVGQSKPADSGIGCWVRHYYFASAGWYSPTNGETSYSGYYATDIAYDSGRYLIIKYRTQGAGDTAALQLRVGTDITSKYDLANIGDKTVSLGLATDWQVAVVDLDGLSQWDKEGAHKLSINLQATAALTLDIAFVATTDTLDEMRSFVEDNTYVFEGKGTEWATVGIEKYTANDFCVTEHNISATPETSGDLATGKTYTYGCTNCAYKYERKIPATNNFYFDAFSEVGQFGTTISTAFDKDADGVYKRFTMSGAANVFVTSTTFWGATSEEYMPGKYLVLKYRTSNCPSLSLRVAADGTSTKDDLSNLGSKTTALATDWTVAVIDLSSLGNKWTVSTANKINIALVTTAPTSGETTLDIAYIATADNLDEVKALVTDKEYEMCNTSTWLTGGTKINTATGECIGEHSISAEPVILGDLASGKTYTYGCTNCAYKYERKIPATDNYYADAFTTMGQYQAPYTTVFEGDIDGAYRRFTVANGKGAEIYVTNESGTVQKALTSGTYKLGRYLVMKYRTSNLAGGLNINIAGGTTNAYAMGLKTSYLPTEWTVAVIDLSQFSGYTVGAEASMYIRLVIGTNNTGSNAVLDLAYIATVDTIDEMKALVTDDSYVWQGAVKAYDSTNNPTTSWQNGGVTVPRSAEKIIFADEYVNDCFDDYQISASVTGDASTTYKYAHNVGTSASATTAQYFILKNAADLGAASGTNTTYNVHNAKWFVLKLRSSKSGNDIAFGIGSSAVVGKNRFVVPVKTAGEWTTYAVDLSNITEIYKKTNGDYIVDTVYAHIENFSSTDSFDVAYMAFLTDWSEVLAITDTDTIELIVNADGTTSTYNKDGSNLTAVSLNKDVESMITDKAENELQFIHFADIHRGFDQWNRIISYSNTYSSYIDFLVHAGDYLGGTNNPEQNFDLYGEAPVQSIKPLYNAVGNHDSFATKDPITTIDKQSVLDALFNHTEGWNVNYMGGDAVNTCYYRDFPDQKVRFIVLDNYYNVDEQIVWLKALLNEAKELDYSVLTSLHETTASIVTPLDTSFCSSTITSLSAPTTKFDTVLGEFISGGGKFIANLAGHHHVDYIGYTANGVLNIVVEVAAATKVPEEQTEGRSSSPSDRSYDAFNVININHEDGTLEIVRVGNNIGSENSQKTSLKLNYINKTIVSENGVSK